MRAKAAALEAEVGAKEAAVAEKEEAGKAVRRSAEERRAEQTRLLDERKARFNRSGTTRQTLPPSTALPRAALSATIQAIPSCHTHSVARTLLRQVPAPSLFPALTDPTPRTVRTTSPPQDLESKQQDLLSQQATLQTEKTAAEMKFSLSGSKNLMAGWRNVNKIAKAHNIEGVHGAVIELFNCKQQYNTAVEVVAGNALFHIVVETDAVASKLTEHLINTKGGRVTFLPLNRLVRTTLFPPDADRRFCSRWAGLGFSGTW